MNRRRFLQTVAVATAAAPTVCFGAARAAARATGLTYRHQPKTFLELSFSPAERQLMGLLQQHSRGCYLFGGPVLSKVAGDAPSWVNFLVDCRNFTKLKHALFSFGVTPISTPELPASFAKFLHAGQVFNLMNCQLDEFCQLNRLNSRANLIPFAHNFLIYDPARSELADPGGALTVRGKDGRPQIVLLAQPRSIAESFDVVLSGRFDCRLLALEPSRDVADFEHFVLHAHCPDDEAPRIVERVVNYLPDAIELLGWPTASELAQAPMVQQAVGRGLGVEMAEICRRVDAAKSERGAVLYALLKEGMGVPRVATGFEDGLCLYLARNGYGLRRMDVSYQSTRLAG
jgi:hypothetical protein